MTLEDTTKRYGSSGSFDLKALEHTLNYIKSNSYNYLYRSQIDLAGFKRFDLKMSDLKPISTITKKAAIFPRKYVAFIKENFISDHARLAYKRSPFYNKELSIFDVANNPQIFNYVYMVFIDGRFYDTINLVCGEDTTNVIFDIKEDMANPSGIPGFHFEELMDANADITVLFMPNCAYGIYNTNRNVLNKYKDNLSLQRFDLTTNMSTDAKYLTFINDHDWLFASVITDTDSSKDMLRFHDNTLENFKNKQVHLNIFGFRNLLDEIDLSIGFPTMAEMPNAIPDAPQESVYTCAVSPNGKYLAITYFTAGLRVYKILEDGSFVKLMDFPALPFGEMYMDCTFSHDSKYLVVCSNGASGIPITMYGIDENDVFTKLPNLSGLPTGSSRVAAFSDDDQYLVFSHSSKPYFSVYKRNGVSFTKLPDFANLSTGTGVYGCSFSPGANYLAITHTTGSKLSIFKRNGDTFTKLTDVSTTSSPTQCRFSHDGNYLAIATSASPFIAVLKRSGDSFIKINDPDVPLPWRAKRVEFSNDNKFIGVAHENAPYLTLYRFDGQRMVKTTNPPTLPKGTGNSISFYPKTNEFIFVSDNVPYVGKYQYTEKKFFTIPRKDMPVPTENMLIFRTVDGKKYFAHDVKIKMYYPNVYEIIGNAQNDALTIYPFYFDDTVSIGEHYDDRFEFAKQMLKIDISNYVLGTVPPYIRDFKPNEYLYDFKDFDKSSEYPDHLQYKINKLQEWILLNGDNMKEYIREQYEDMTNGTYIDCSKIDLTKKYRENNHQEITYPSQQETFEEPRYVFILRNKYDDPYLFYRFFVDGILWVPDKYYKDSWYEYYYIPVSMIKPDTVIEFERFDTFSFNTPVTFSANNERKRINFVTPRPIYANDIFMINSATKEFIAEDKYKLTVVENGTDIDLPVNSFKRIASTFDVTLLDNSLVNVPLTLYIKEYFYFEQKIITSDEEDGSFTFASKTNNDATYIRMFRDGRFLPTTLYSVAFDTKMDGIHFVTAGVIKHIGQRYVIDYTPFSYKTIYQQDILDPTGIVDLRGKIDKPFDLKWFDLYLNGRKLHFKNVDILSPTLLRIKKVESLNNLFILQKNRDPEMFILDGSNTPTDILWDTVPEFKDSVTSQVPPIVSTEPPLDAEAVDLASLDWIRLFKDFIINFTWINPDLVQITDASLWTRYPAIFSKVDKALLLNPDDFPTATTKLKIMPE